MTDDDRDSPGDDHESPGDHHASAGDRLSAVQLTTWSVIGLAVVTITGLFSVRLEHQPETTRDYPPRPLIEDGEATLLEHQTNDEYLPCGDCHNVEDQPTDPTRRELEFEHEDKKLAHGDLWCLHCHDSKDPNDLHLADGTLIPFEESWKLCTQCHGKKLPEWQAGVHGKVTGHWRGDREYLTCVACHNPHSPPTEPIEPKPKPKRPEEISVSTDISMTSDSGHVQEE